MKKSRQERLEETQRLEAVIEDVRKQLMQYPNVRSVGYGLREVRGELTSEACIRVYVKKKVGEGTLSDSERLPKEIAGFRVDVIEDTGTVLVPAPAGDSSSYRPLWGGIQVTAEGAGGTGTMGCLVTLDADSKIHILSNHHVLIGDAGAVGKLVGQAGGPCSSRCCVCSTIAVVAAALDNARVDAAIARLYGTNAGDPTKIPYQNSIVGIGPIFGPGPVQTAPNKNTLMDDIVRKRGARTGLTVGRVADPNYNPGGPKDQQILISVISGARHMVWGGDSGSALVDYQNRVVGLIYARTGVAEDDYDTCPVRQGIANQITEVQNAMLCTVMSSGTAGVIPASGFERELVHPSPTANPAVMLDLLERELKQRPGGPSFMNALHENRGEVMDLINDNREVKVAWHRYQGPAFVGHLVKKSNAFSHPLPKQIEGYTFQNLLIKMSDVLERHGSRSLSKAVEDYSTFAFEFAADYGEDKIVKSAAEQACDQCGTFIKGS